MHSRAIPFILYVLPDRPNQYCAHNWVWQLQSSSCHGL